MTRDCPSMLGAVKPTFDEPSLLSAQPRIRHRSGRRHEGRLPFFSGDNGDAAAKNVPCAAASKVRQCPSGDVIPPSDTQSRVFWGK